MEVNLDEVYAHLIVSINPLQTKMRDSGNPLYQAQKLEESSLQQGMWVSLN